MKWKIVKKSEELVKHLFPMSEGQSDFTPLVNIPLSLYDIQLDLTGETLNSVLLITSRGQIRIRKESYSGIYLEIPEPPTKKQIWIVGGTIEGVELEAKQFESEYEAEHHYSRLQAAGVVATKVEETLDVYPE